MQVLIGFENRKKEQTAKTTVQVLSFIILISNVSQIGNKLKTTLLNYLRCKVTTVSPGCLLFFKEIPSTIEKRMMFWYICQKKLCLVWWRHIK